VTPVRVGTTAALLTFVVLLVRFYAETFIERGATWNNAYLQDIVDYITISITLLVVAVPEGLPLAVVLALAYSIKVLFAVLVPRPTQPFVPPRSVNEDQVWLRKQMQVWFIR